MVYLTELGTASTSRLFRSDNERSTQTWLRSFVFYLKQYLGKIQFVFLFMVCFTLQPTYSQSATLLHRYSFNDGTSRDSIRGAAGTLMGTSLPSITAGKVVLNAASAQGVQLPSSAFGSYSQYSVEMWVDTGSSSGDTPLFAWGTTSNSYMNIVYVANVLSPSVVSATFTDANAKGCTSTSSQSFYGQTGMYVALTVSQNVLTLYINYASSTSGTILAQSCPSDMAALPSVNFFHIGSFPTGFLQGSVDKFRVWGGLLSATDIAAHFAGGPSM